METEDLPDEDIIFWTDFVVLSQEAFLKKYPIHNTSEDVEETPLKYKAIRNNISAGLYTAVVKRGVSEFQRELTAPLAYIAVNLYICKHEHLSSPERLIAQLFATGEEKYARYLDQRLSKMNPFWNSENTISYGEMLREWAKNSYEYYLLQNHFPDTVPKSKGAYTAAKNKRSKKYQLLKKKAEGLGIILED